MPKLLRLLLLALLLAIPCFLAAPRVLKWSKLVYVNVLVSAPGSVEATPGYEELLPDPAEQTAADEFRVAVSRLLRRNAHITTPSQETDLEGADGWFYSCAELHMALIEPEAYTPAAQEIIHFHQHLATRDLRLLFVSLPCKWEIHPEGIPLWAKQAAPFNVQRIAFVKQLQDAGVWCLDLGRPLRDYRSNHPDAKLYFNGDHHWTPLGASIAADFVAAQMNQKLPASQQRTAPPELTDTEFSFALPTRNNTTEAVPARVFPEFDGHIQRYQTVLLGDSFSFPEGQSLRTKEPRMIGFPPLLSLATKRGIETITYPGGNGSGAMARREFVRRATQEKGYLAEKELVIWEIQPVAYVHRGGYFPRIELPEEPPVGAAEQTSHSTPHEIEIIAAPEIDLDKLGPYTEAVAGVLGRREGGETALYYIQVIKERTLLNLGEELQVGERLRVRSTTWGGQGVVRQGPSNAYLFEPDPFDPILKQFWIEEILIP